MRMRLGMLVLALALCGCETRSTKQPPPPPIPIPKRGVSDGTYEFVAGGEPADRDAPEACWFYLALKAAGAPVDGTVEMSGTAWRPDGQAVTVERVVWTGTELVADLHREYEVAGSLEREQLRAVVRPVGALELRGVATVTLGERPRQLQLVMTWREVDRAALEEEYAVRQAQRQAAPPAEPDDNGPPTNYHDVAKSEAEVRARARKEALARGETLSEEDMAEAEARGEIKRE